MMVTKNNPVSY